MTLSFHRCGGYYSPKISNNLCNQNIIQSNEVIFSIHKQCFLLENQTYTKRILPPPISIGFNHEFIPKRGFTNNTNK